MAASKQLAALLAAAAVTAAQADPLQDADSLLRKALNGIPKVNVTLIQSILSPDGFDLVVKLQSDGNGRSRRVVLQPLREQGMYAIDDGKTWFTVNPDRNEIFIQDSPARFRPCPKMRWGLIEQNYKLSMGATERVAGKRAMTVVATPKAPGMSVRRYTIEPDTGLVLRIQVTDSARTKTLVDTIDAKFNIDRDPVLFTPPDFDRNKLVRCPSPRIMRKASDARPFVGFEPQVPKKLPLGFSIYETHVLGANGDAFVGFRLSDGLATATLYQYREGANTKEAPFEASEGIRNSQGIFFVLRGDLPEAARKKLLQAFLERMKLQAAVFGELPDLRPMLDLLRQLSEMSAQGSFGSS
ncbi:MAG: hypothetical protein HONBIEJF_01337 [Fimbriimonadaceae bacterium]|nr:hypothetical protein [Fimbriimonadaceae bacterium]